MHGTGNTTDAYVSHNNHNFTNATKTDTGPSIFFPICSISVCACNTFQLVYGRVAP